MGDVAALDALLEDLNREQATRLSFEPSATTHFATITTFPATAYAGQPLGPILLFATSYHGPRGVHVRELVALMGQGLRTIFAHCQGFVAACTDDQLVAWMVRHDRQTTFYSGMHHLSRKDVLRNQKLRDAIGEYLDRRGDVPNDSYQLRRDIQQFVREQPDLEWAEKERWKPTLLAQLIYYWRSLVMEGAALALLVGTVACFFVGGIPLKVLVIAGWTALFAFAAYIYRMLRSVRRAEDNQTYLSVRPSNARARMLAATQMRPVINEFTLGGAIKDEEQHRPRLLTIGLWVIARYSDGFPGLKDPIRIPTVATARWIACDGGRRLLFISNYTNDGVGYVRDFIETKGGAENINISFGFGRGFPRTKWVYQDGAYTDPNTYLYALTENQSVTKFWYGPYRDISIDNIRRDRAIREGLFDDLDEQQTKEWLHLL